MDDVLALFVALDNPVKPLAITTTHIEPREKAQIAKLVVTYAGFSEIPVYAGIGTTRNDPRELFLQQNPLWPLFLVILIHYQEKAHGFLSKQCLTGR
ncbi:TPA: hypothetical protein ACGAEL_000769 [Legionella pneumophila]|nr:hypothetical protein [Legionella pneumophila]